MRDLCADHVVLANEIAPYGKDHAQGDLNILLTLLQQTDGPALGQAAAWIRSTADEALR